MQPNLFDVIKQVFSSWQVIAITLFLILYIHIVSYVSRRYHRPRALKKKKLNLFKKNKNKTAVVLNTGPEEALSSSNANDELGLEEA